MQSIDHFSHGGLMTVYKVVRDTIPDLSPFFGKNQIRIWEDTGGPGETAMMFRQGLVHSITTNIDKFHEGIFEIQIEFVWCWCQKDKYTSFSPCASTSYTAVLRSFAEVAMFSRFGTADIVEPKPGWILIIKNEDNIRWINQFGLDNDKPRSED